LAKVYSVTVITNFCRGALHFARYMRGYEHGVTIVAVY